MPTLTYEFETRCLNCKYTQITSIRRGCRWINASDAMIGSGYYKNNDPTKKVKKVCEFCGCDALRRQSLVTKEELEGTHDQA